MFDRCTTEEVELNAEIARRIQFRRNTVVHGGEFIHPNILIHAASAIISAYRTAMAKDTVVGAFGAAQAPHGEVPWKPPPFKSYKVNQDAALDAQNGKMGFGYIVRDSTGMVDAAVCHSVESLAELVIAESLAALRAVEFCRNRGFHKLFWKVIP